MKKDRGPPKWAQQGSPLSADDRKTIVVLKHYFDDTGGSVGAQSVERVARSLGIGTATVRRVLADYNKDGCRSFRTTLKRSLFRYLQKWEGDDEGPPWQCMAVEGSYVQETPHGCILHRSVPNTSPFRTS